MEIESFESAWRTACECNVLLGPNEGKALYDRVMQAPDHVVEVGSYFGGSAVILARAGAEANADRSLPAARAALVARTHGASSRCQAAVVCRRATLASLELAHLVPVPRPRA